MCRALLASEQDTAENKLAELGCHSLALPTGTPRRRRCEGAFIAVERNDEDGDEKNEAEVDVVDCCERAGKQPSE